MVNNFKKIGILISVILILFAINYIFAEGSSILKYYIELFNYVGVVQSTIYAILVFISFLALASLIFQKNRFSYAISLTLMLLLYILNFVYIHVNKEGFSYEDLSIIINEADAFGIEAILTFSNSLYFAISIVVVIFVCFWILRKIIIKENLYLPNGVIYLLLSISILGTYFVVHKTANSTNDFPAPQKIIDTLIYYSANKIYNGKRENLAKSPEKNIKFKNIIWIIDESVGGSYLSLNGYNKRTTPYLESIDNHIINLGIASSAANCSGTSNLILMSGIQINQLPDQQQLALKKPSIFQYAKNANYTTSYISGQSYDMKLQNFITKYDLEHIDNFQQPVKNKKHLKSKIPEEMIIKEISKTLKTHENNFIYIVKEGAHFHYESSYPASKKIFTPTLLKNESMSENNKEKIFNSYANAIRWRVDEFFKYLFEKTDILNRDDTIIIYTSDHGQSIVENGVLATHCTANNPPITQAVVPFILFVKDKNLLSDNIFKMKNKATHYMMFPTTLRWMGYTTKCTTLCNGSTRDKQEFFSGDVFGRGSGKIEYIN